MALSLERLYDRYLVIRLGSSPHNDLTAHVIYPSRMLLTYDASQCSALLGALIYIIDMAAGGFAPIRRNLLQKTERMYIIMYQNVLN